MTHAKPMYYLKFFKYFESIVSSGSWLYIIFRMIFIIIWSNSYPVDKDSTVLTYLGFQW